MSHLLPARSPVGGHYLVFLTVAALTACGSTATTPAAQSAATTPAAQSAASQGGASAAASPQPAASCTVQTAAQYLTDMTPVTIQYSGPGALAECASSATKRGAKLVTSAPLARPVCKVNAGGLEAAVYGTAAAQTVCAQLSQQTLLQP